MPEPDQHAAAQALADAAFPAGNRLGIDVDKLEHKGLRDRCYVQATRLAGDPELLGRLLVALCGDVSVEQLAAWRDEVAT